MMEKFIKNNKDLTLVLGTVLILTILFSPIPPAILDLSIIMNFGLAFTILLLTFYVAKPVEFSTFPSILLIATLFRLSLNVASTRLILTDADAGDVIDSIGGYAVQGNIVIGLVVFAILVVVQYLVVTSGAQRVSEVAARFTLDSMPGQQMSIDADLNLGLIDQKEAQARRKELESEAAFYGSMDGASKFVKGDAIASIIILLINLIAGLIVGVLQMGMTWGDAMHRFTLLTVGDGIATQFPALIISVATGIIVTRSSADRELSTEIFKQLGSVRRVPLIVAGILFAIMLLPGMPKWPIALVVTLAAFGWLRSRNAGRQESALTTDGEHGAEDEEQGDLRAIEIRLGSELMAAWHDRQAILLDRVAAQRKTIEASFGFAYPKVVIVEQSALGGHDYQIAIHGSAYGAGQLFPDRMLALRQNEDSKPIEGIRGRDPAFGLDGVWIEPRLAQEGRDAGYSVIDPETVLTTHLNEVIKAEISVLLTRAATIELLDEVRRRQPGLVEELVPNVMTPSDIQRVLQNLLQERVSIANIDLILETLVDIGRHDRDPRSLGEKVRQSLAVSICSALRGHHRELAVLSLEPRLENRIITQSGDGATENLIAVEPRLVEQLLKALAPLVDNMLRQGRTPVLLCAGSVRRTMMRLTQRTMPQLSVISVEEVPMRISLVSFAIVKLEDNPVPELAG
ncbi:flagellar biosynthesis protein FlhA [Altererythrobacter sp. Z27]|uniref:flagellar biosynthesis protein FlhA n=1 Tax=Altererythrobacter sp. Z27 TaxID=3461147 RepID=UPI004043B882